MPKRKSIALDFEVDELTNSIVNTITGDSFPTEVSPITPEDLARIRKDKTWLFDWGKEYKKANCRVYKLTVEYNPHIIQGLACFEVMQDHVFMHLIESACFNRGAQKMYKGVMGNLVAFGCKLSFEKGFEGCLSFIAKTALIQHYIDSLGAMLFGARTMIIETKSALQLTQKYFPDEYKNR
jgi:hypothetical protein